MEPVDNIRRIDKGVPREFALALRMAKDNGWWIYQQSTKKWFTPEEFQEVAHRLIKREGDGRTNSDDFAPASPWVGLNKRVKFLEQVTAEIAEFAIRMEAFYRKREHPNR